MESGDPGKPRTRPVSLADVYGIRDIGEKTMAITETKETQETARVRAQPEPLYTNNQFEAANKALNAYDFGDGWRLDETDERWTQAATGTELSIGVFITKTVDGEDAPVQIYEDLTYKASFDPIDRTLTNALVVDRQGQTYARQTDIEETFAPAPGR